MQIVQPAVVQYFSNNNCLKIDDREAAKVSLFLCRLFYTNRDARFDTSSRSESGCNT